MPDIADVPKDLEYNPFNVMKLREQGYSLSQIGKVFGRSDSCIAHYVKRNGKRIGSVPMEIGEKRGDLTLSALDKISMVLKNVTKESIATLPVDKLPTLINALSALQRSLSESGQQPGGTIGKQVNNFLVMLHGKKKNQAQMDAQYAELKELRRASVIGEET